MFHLDRNVTKCIADTGNLAPDPFSSAKTDCACHLTALKKNVNVENFSMKSEMYQQ